MPQPSSAPPPYQPYELPAHQVHAHAQAHGKRDSWVGAPIAEVEPDSPAAREGLEPGMLITHVNGAELRDLITWNWEADHTDVYLEGTAHPGTPAEFDFECTLTRDFGQDWGLTFDGAIFDGMRLCCNNCSFCFMKMLPKGMRKTLYMRDDDYRLSFLQGNFVTLTNMSDADVQRVIQMRLEPLNVSLHAISPEVRLPLIGPHAARGVEVLEQLLAAGLEIHGQIVLVPHVNDGAELEKTLAWIEQRPLITSVGIVPLGFTKHQDDFTSSYSSDPALAAQVVDIVTPYQQRSRARRGSTCYQLSDEFYLFSHGTPPPAEAYDGYPQYYDGIGMVRSFLDEMQALTADKPLMARLASTAQTLARSAGRLDLVCGEAVRGITRQLCRALGLEAVSRVHAIRNDYFGGNVDVTGLITAQDLLAQLPACLAGSRLFLPEIMFNADGMTLDGSSTPELLELLRGRGADPHIIDGTPTGFARCVADLVLPA